MRQTLHKPFDSLNISLTENSKNLIQLVMMMLKLLKSKIKFSYPRYFSLNISNREKR